MELAKKLAEVLTIEQIAAMLGHSNRKNTKGHVHKRLQGRGLRASWAEWNGGDATSATHPIFAAKPLAPRGRAG